jgi:hypothetical protein
MMMDVMDAKDVNGVNGFISRSEEWLTPQWLM